MPRVLAMGGEVASFTGGASEFDVAATVIAMRLYNNSKEGITGRAGSPSGSTAASA